MERSELFILQAFAAANPLYCLSLCKDLGSGSDPLLLDLMRFLDHPARTPRILGFKDRVESLVSEVSGAVRVDLSARVMPVVHVFPVYAPALGAGFVVPLDITPDEDWHVSDAFGTFGFLDPAQKNVTQILQGLLARMERAWSEIHEGTILPLRWRKALSLRLLCPVHFDAIGGQSLQVPLIVAVLRSLAESPASSSSPAVLPFGNVPVFATGVLGADGNFGWVEHLPEKLEAFLREYGSGLPAILTTTQIGKLKSDGKTADLLKRVQVHEANSIADLMRLPELRRGLDRIAAPPPPTEVDGILTAIQRMRQSIRFSQIESLTRWLLQHVRSPVYRFQLLRQAGLVLAHRGLFTDAWPFVAKAEELFHHHQDIFGIAERFQLATALGTLAFDACDPLPAIASLERLIHELPRAQAVDRARFWGTLCQLYRLSGRYDEAVEAGLRAVEMADLSLAGESGRDRNYLIHALIARAKKNPSDRKADLDEASRLLAESQGLWAPAGDSRGLQNHLGFCLHYQAEIARLNGLPFEPPSSPPWAGIWGHTWLFVLLSCARNQRHDRLQRVEYGHELVRACEAKVRDPVSLFALFLSVYRVYLSALNGHDPRDLLVDLKTWCQRMAEKGFPGWQQHIAPWVDAFETGREDPLRNAEGLCDAIPYH